MVSVWPKANFCHFLLFTSKQNCLQKNECALARPVIDSNHHAKFHHCILSGFCDGLSKLNNNNNNKNKNFEN